MIPPLPQVSLVSILLQKQRRKLEEFIFVLSSIIGEEGMGRLWDPGVVDNYKETHYSHSMCIYIHKSSDSVQKTCASPCQTKSQHKEWKWRFTQSYPLAVELLPIVKFSQRFSLGSLPHSSGRPHNHKILGLTKWSLGIKKDETVLCG